LLFELVGAGLDMKLHLVGQLPVEAPGAAYVAKPV
jgi:hypothetical protein